MDFKDNYSQDSANNEQDNPGIGWQILAFFIPLAGWIMAYNNREKFPQKSKRYNQLALAGFFTALIFRILDRI